MKEHLFPMSMVVFFALAFSFSANCNEEDAPSAVKETFPFQVDFAPNKEIPLNEKDEFTYLGLPITVKYKSEAPLSRIVCVGNPIQGEEGYTIPVENIYLEMNFDPFNESKKFTSGPLPLKAPLILSEGGSTKGIGMNVVNIFQILVSVGPDAPPGDYYGVLNLFVEIEPGNPIPVPNIEYCFKIPHKTSISTDPSGMQFGYVFPGNHVSLNAPWVRISTTKKKLQVGIEMSNLTSSGVNVIPLSQLGVAYGDTQAKALEKAGSVSWGNTYLSTICKKGITFIYLGGRSKITMDDNPGEYRGVIVITLSDCQ